MADRDPVADLREALSWWEGEQSDSMVQNQIHAAGVIVAAQALLAALPELLAAERQAGYEQGTATHGCTGIHLEPIDESKEIW